jgi:glycosyltransferase involved in cell wall biosynthesis
MFHPQNHDDEDSQLAHEQMRKKYGNPDEDALRGLPGTKTPLLLAVGRLVGRKGFRTLLRAMPAILSENSGAHLVIVGRGHMRKTLLKQAKNLGIKDAVTIEPGMPFSDLAQLFRSADLSVYPSLYEGQGLIPLESMASGTPCATVNDGPLPEMVDETVGGLFEVGNPNSLAKTVNNLLGNPENIPVLVANGQKRVAEEYTYRLNAEKYAIFYSE